MYAYLYNLFERMDNLVELEVIIDECGNVAGKYTDRDHINDYMDCEVEIIDAEDDTLIVTVIDDPEE